MFVSFEGIDFCGKSTQVELLKSFLVRRKKQVEIIREPGGTEISERVRKILLDKNHSNFFMETEIFLFSASRAQLVREKIRPLLKNGYFVISDRFHDSSTAYQGFGRGIPLETINQIHKLAIGETIPDLTFLLDISVEEMQKRKFTRLNFQRKEPDRIETSDIDFFNRVRNGYLYLSKKEERFVVIDGSKNIDEIHNKIVNEISRVIKKELV
jgi:dTMP kinase